MMLIILNILFFVWVAGAWYDSETAVNCQVNPPLPLGTLPVNAVPTTFQLSPQPGLLFLVAPKCDSFMFAWQQCLLFFWLRERAGMTALPLAHEYKPLMASHTAGVSESVDQTLCSIKLPASTCIIVCVEKHTANCCSSRVTADKISRHWFPPHLTLAERRILHWYNCFGSLLCSCWIDYELADGYKQWMTNMTYTTQTALTL